MLKSGSIFGHYRIKSCIGVGGMGTVYRAIDTRLNRSVALKLVSDRYARIPGYKERLKQEARKAAQIDSSHVVKVWEYSEVDERQLIAFEYVKGDDLRTASLNRSFDQKTELAHQIASGMAAAHNLDVLHRDLKPENILVTDSNQAKILDFGLAKTVNADNFDDQGNIEGTLYYLSPEQLAGEKLGCTSDLFSYGALLYEMYTGRRAFDGEYPASIVYSILHESPESPSGIDATLPEWIDGLILKLLAKEPCDRFQSFPSVLQYLDSIRTQSGVSSSVGDYEIRKKTVTVLDIKNLSGDQSWDYFCHGFTEDLIREVSRRSRLVVTAEPESGDELEVREVFRKCRSDFVLTGSLMKWEDTVKLNITTYGDLGEHVLFAETYQGESRSLFQLMSDAAGDASQALAEATGEPVPDVGQYLMTDLSAYEYYAKGRSYYQTNRPDDLKFAEKMFTKALEIDSSLALAHTGLSDVHAFEYMAYYDRAPERIEKARTEAHNALNIDPNLPEAHRSLGRYYMLLGRIEAARDEFLKAVELDPKFAIGLRTLAWLEEGRGKIDRALGWAKKALALAPTDLETLLLLGLLYLDQRNYSLALATLLRAIELGPHYGRAYLSLGTVYTKLGFFDLAIENFLLAVKYEGDPSSHIEAGYAYLLKGDSQAAQEMFEESASREYYPFISFYFLGLAHRLQGRAKVAEGLFERSLRAADDFLMPDPENADVLSYKALAYAALDRQDEALSTVAGFEERSGQFGDLLFNIARCYALLRQPEMAKRYAKLAKERRNGPTDKEILADPHFAVPEG